MTRRYDAEHLRLVWRKTKGEPLEEQLRWIQTMELEMAERRLRIKNMEAAQQLHFTTSVNRR